MTDNELLVNLALGFYHGGRVNDIVEDILDDRPGLGSDEYKEAWVELSERANRVAGAAYILADELPDILLAHIERQQANVEDEKLGEDWGRSDGHYGDLGG